MKKILSESNLDEITASHEDNMLIDTIKNQLIVLKEFLNVKPEERSKILKNKSFTQALGEIPKKESKELEAQIETTIHNYEIMILSEVFTKEIKSIRRQISQITTADHYSQSCHTALDLVLKRDENLSYEHRRQALEKAKIALEAAQLHKKLMQPEYSQYDKYVHGHYIPAALHVLIKVFDPEQKLEKNKEAITKVKLYIEAYEIDEELAKLVPPKEDERSVLFNEVVGTNLKKVVGTEALSLLDLKSAVAKARPYRSYKDQEIIAKKAESILKNLSEEESKEDDFIIAIKETLSKITPLNTIVENQKELTKAEIYLDARKKAAQLNNLQQLGVIKKETIRKAHIFLQKMLDKQASLRDIQSFLKKVESCFPTAEIEKASLISAIAEQQELFQSKYFDYLSLDQEIQNKLLPYQDRHDKFTLLITNFDNAIKTHAYLSRPVKHESTVLEFVEAHPKMEYKISFIKDKEKISQSDLKKLTNADLHKHLMAWKDSNESIENQFNELKEKEKNFDQKIQSFDEGYEKNLGLFNEFQQDLANKKQQAELISEIKSQQELYKSTITDYQTLREKIEKNFSEYLGQYDTYSIIYDDLQTYKTALVIAKTNNFEIKSSSIEAESKLIEFYHSHLTSKPNFTKLDDKAPDSDLAQLNKKELRTRLRKWQDDSYYAKTQYDQLLEKDKSLNAKISFFNVNYGKNNKFRETEADLRKKETEFSTEISKKIDERITSLSQQEHKNQDAKLQNHYDPLKANFVSVKETLAVFIDHCENQIELMNQSIFKRLFKGPLVTLKNRLVSLKNKIVDANGHPNITIRYSTFKTEILAINDLLEAFRPRLKVEKMQSYVSSLIAQIDTDINQHNQLIVEVKANEEIEQKRKIDNLNSGKDNFCSVKNHEKAALSSALTELKNAILVDFKKLISGDDLGNKIKLVETLLAIYNDSLAKKANLRDLSPDTTSEEITTTLDEINQALTEALASQQEEIKTSNHTDSKPLALAASDVRFFHMVRNCKRKEEAKQKNGEHKFTQLIQHIVCSKTEIEDKLYATLRELKDAIFIGRSVFYDTWSEKISTVQSLLKTYHELSASETDSKQIPSTAAENIPGLLEEINEAIKEAVQSQQEMEEEIEIKTHGDGKTLKLISTDARLFKIACKLKAEQAQTPKTRDVTTTFRPNPRGNTHRSTRTLSYG